MLNQTNFNGLLSQEDQSILNDALYYMKMTELKNACLMLKLPSQGKKIELIKRIMTFVKSGKIIENPKLSEKSLAKNYPAQYLSPDSLMLYGSYKNDARTRAFFKNLIGSHFHFTACGLDWLNDRWLKGNPPTYQEFANYWIEETKRHKLENPKPKDEWQFINFLQQMNKENPPLAKDDLMVKWKQLQASKLNQAKKILNKINKKL